MPLSARVLSSSESSAVLTWSEPKIDGGRRELWYRVECKTCPPGTQYSPGSARLNRTTITLRNLQPARNYSVLIFAENEISRMLEDVPAYAHVEVRTDSVVQVKVGNLRVLAATDDLITLAWQPPRHNRITNYQVEYGAVAGNADPRRKDLPNVEEVELSGLSPGTQYRIRVRALTSNGWGTWSDYQYADTAGATANRPREAAPESSGSTTVVVLIVVGCLILLFLLVIFFLVSRPTSRLHRPSQAALRPRHPRLPSWYNSLPLSLLQLHPVDSPHPPLLFFLRQWLAFPASIDVSGPSCRRVPFSHLIVSLTAPHDTHAHSQTLQAVISPPTIQPTDCTAAPTIIPLPGRVSPTPILLLACNPCLLYTSAKPRVPFSAGRSDTLGSSSFARERCLWNFLPLFDTLTNVNALFAVTAPLMSDGGLGFKPYVDPFAYEDPNLALREFASELDPKYLFIDKVILGGGEFGEVHQARLKLPGRPDEIVAVKSLLPGASAKAREDFLQEAAVMGQFSHPNVVRLKGVISRSDPVMIITEFMANKSLDQYLRSHDGQLDAAVLVGMLRGICAGMKYLSDKGYVHRDLAARNVLVAANGTAKISDFGLSRGMRASDTEQVYTTKGGKIPVRWTAPEAIAFRKYTSASDVWSFGIVAWEVASFGERPYWDWSNQNVIGAVNDGYRLSSPQGCPKGLYSLMTDCWAHERTQRPTFAALLSRIDKFLAIPDLLHEASSTANSTLSSDLYDHHGSPNPPPPAPLPHLPLGALPSVQELLGTLGLAHFAPSMAAHGVLSLHDLARLGIVDLMTYGLGQVDCQRIRDAVARFGAVPAHSTLPRHPHGHHPTLPSALHQPPLTRPSIATLHAPGRPDQGYFI